MDFELAKEEFSDLLGRVNALKTRMGVQETDVVQRVNDCEALIGNFYSLIPQSFSRQIISIRYASGGSVYQRLQSLEGVLKSILKDIDIRAKTTKTQSPQTFELVDTALKQSEDATKKYSDLLDEWNDLVPKWNELTQRVDEELEPTIERQQRIIRKFRLLFFIAITLFLTFANFSIPFLIGWQDWNKTFLIQIIVFIAIILAYNDKARISLFDFGKKHTVEGIGKAYQALVLAALTVFLIWAIWYFFKVDLPKEYEKQTAPKTDSIR